MNDTLEHAMFYNSKNGDRKYDAESFEHWLKKFFTTGVFTGDMQTVANDDMTVSLKKGYVNIDGKVKVFKSDQKFVVETAHATYDRIDSVVIERNDTDRDIIAKVIKGGYSSEPAPKKPVRENGIYQLTVAQIHVKHGAVKITQEDVKDTRTDKDLCGIVAATVKEIDFTQIQAQFDGYIKRQQSEFEQWFDAMKKQLSTDAAGKLQQQIDNILSAGNVLSEKDVNGIFSELYPKA